MKSRNWQRVRQLREARHGKPCSLKPSTFQSEPSIDKPSPPARPGSVTSIFAACNALIDETPVPKPDAIDQEQADRVRRLQDGDWGGPDSEENRDKQRERWRLKKQRQRAAKHREWETQVTNATKNDKLHRYFRSVLKGTGPRGG